MKFSIGCGAYDRTWPLIASAITIDGVEFDWNVVPPEVAFTRGMVDGAYEISELSFSTYLLQKSRGENRYTALPVFLSRAFRHSAIYIRSDAGIEKPEDLKGRNIGVPEWQLSANVWVRGILSDEHDVAVESVNWFIGDIDEPGRKEKVPVQLPETIRHQKIADDQTLWGLMQEGGIDAIIAPRSPRALEEGDPRIRRLFTNVKDAEQAYYQKTGIFPIMHLLGIRNDVLDKHPELPARLYDGFERARQHGMRELGQVAYFYVMIPWLVDHMRETRAIMGDDYWPYGIEKNRKVLETMCRYHFDQGISERRMTAEELFVSV